MNNLHSLINIQPDPRFSTFLNYWYEQYTHSFLNNYIDFSSMGWMLFLFTLMIYIISKQEWVRLRKELHQYAMFDMLTGLPNRRLFHEQISQMLAIGKRDNRKLILMLGDMDGFKNINDSLGHHAGDQFLQAVSKRFRKTLRESDSMARLGGDEFAIFFLADDDEAAHGAAERFLRVMKEPFPIEGLSFTVGISLGIAIAPDHGEDIESLLRRADIALYQAKKVKNTHIIYACNDMETGNVVHLHTTAAG